LYALNMITFRTFRNTDPPVLTAIWRSREAVQPMMLPINYDLFEQLVFAKLYFDPAGLVVAWEDGRAVGFAHAGFGSNAMHDGISTECGVTCQLLVRPDCENPELSAGLLRHCEQYLIERGAKVLYGGGFAPLVPFYLGLFNTSELPGVLDSDAASQQVFATHGYREIDTLLLLRRGLGGFEAPIDRRQMEIRRGMIVEVTADAPSRTWWEACTLGEFEITRFEVVPRAGGSPAAWAVFRGMEPSGSSGVSRSIGLLELHVAESFRRRGVAVFLLSEAFRRFLRDGITEVETQSPLSNAAGAAVLRKLGFQEMGRGCVFRKEVEIK
jgi:GNAT superfamily N-acetyltransferase